MGRRISNALALSATIYNEGSLFQPDFLNRIMQGTAPEQKDADYDVPEGLTLAEEVERAFKMATAKATQKDWRHSLSILLRSLGYDEGTTPQPLVHGERSFPVERLLNGELPLLTAENLDEPQRELAEGQRRRSAYRVIQELLNADPRYEWGLVADRERLRLVGHADSLVRPSWLEIRWADILRERNLPDFRALYLLLHASRARGQPNCIWERWRRGGLEEGVRVRERLRDGVEAALSHLGTGFLSWKGNATLRDRLQSGELKVEDFHAQLLRTVYRLLFVITLEERGLLHAGVGDPSLTVKAQQRYRDGYSLGRLTDLCRRHALWDDHGDLWEGAQVVFRALQRGEPALDLPALGGLFRSDQCPDLDVSGLANRHFLAALERLRWTVEENRPVKVDYRNLGPEELGSIYESLLELTPEIRGGGTEYGFAGDPGGTRKSSGSYYTPEALVQELVNSALVPVLEERLKRARTAQDKERELLSLTVLDPAMGSGHFLLGAARVLAVRLVELRHPDRDPTPQERRAALHNVITHCLHGVDVNPMAVELARFTLWLEGYQPGRPLDFLDHHLQVGDSLLGLRHLEVLWEGFRDEAYEPREGDERAVCQTLKRANAREREAWKRERADYATGLFDADLADAWNAVEGLEAQSLADVAEKERRYRGYLDRLALSDLALAADAWVGVFYMSKTDPRIVPTTETLRRLLEGQLQGGDREKLLAAAEAARSRLAFCWPLRFPRVLQAGGFDVVLGNPPWERPKLQEEEFFAIRQPRIAQARNQAERRRLIQQLEHGQPWEQELFRQYRAALRMAEVFSALVHAEQGPYPLTGVGDVNLYALFAEAMLDLRHPRGRVGVVVPTNVATDFGTRAFFQHVVENGLLVSLYDFENREKLFPAVDSRYRFCLLTLGPSPRSVLAFFLTRVEHALDKRRRFSLTREDYARVNPNTRTCPAFRTRADAELTLAIYRRVPVLWEEGPPEKNPWGVRFTRLFDMSNDSALFHTQPAPGRLPLYEAKMVHQFDHRWATSTGGEQFRDCTDAEKANPHFEPAPRYWVDASEVERRLQAQGWDRPWLLGWRDITNATNARTVIASVIPRVGVGHNCPLILTQNQKEPLALVLANLNSLVLDYCARQKVGGTHLTYFIMEQLPLLAPAKYDVNSQKFILPRVLELTYTSVHLEGWARDLGFRGKPFPWDPQRRALLQAELDAFYAKLYGLSRKQLRYILDPADLTPRELEDILDPWEEVEDPLDATAYAERRQRSTYPSETFRALYDNERETYGEYRTRRLVLEAWKRL